MKCEGRSTRTGELECPECHRTWDRTDEAPECRPAPVVNETDAGGILDPKTVRLGLGYRTGADALIRMGRPREGQSGHIPDFSKVKGRKKHD